MTQSTVRQSLVHPGIADEQNRLTWAGSQGTPSCGSSLAVGSLTGAYYSSAFSYDAQNRLTSNTAQGSYSYADPAHLHAATATTTGGYSGSYDAAGDLLCRAPNTTTTCTGGSPTGAQLSYDTERRLTGFSSPAANSSATEAYDGEGNRVSQKATSGATTTTTDYLAGGLEEVMNGTLTKYYSVPGVVTAVNVGGTLSYLAQDGLNTVTEALSASGSVIASQLYGPYGSMRYSNGTMPTAKGYTGEVADAVTGLDYYHARYYDPVLGQFASADSVADGLNRYGYVAGNPETFIDPTGHRRCDDSGCDQNPGDPSNDGVHVTGESTSDPSSSYYTNADFSLEQVITTVTTITYSDGSVKRFVHSTSKNLGCNDNCMTQRKEQAQRLLDEHWAHVRLAAQTGLDVALFVANLLAVIADVAALSGGDEAAWAGLALDLLGLAGAVLSLAKDVAMLWGGKSQGDMQGLSSWGAVIQGLSAAANSVVAIGWLANLNVIGTFKTGLMRAIQSLKPQIAGLAISVAQVGGAASSMTFDYIDAQQGAEQNMTYQQLQDQCHQLGVAGC